MSGPYAVGIDFGTESGRAALVDVSTGDVLATSVVRYPSAVIDQTLPSTGEELPPDWALQDPDDWVTVVETAVPDVLKQAAVDADAVVGLGVDFTSCTVLPVTSDGVPLCTIDKWRERRHAWPKLWKHHSAQPVADRLNEVALERGDAFLERYGGRISSEWYFPKLIEVWLEDREIYDECAGFIEATDWIVWWLTGVECRQTATAGFKAMWSPADGLPPTEYFEAAYPGFDRPGEKLGDTFAPLGTKAGTLRPEVAKRTGLPRVGGGCGRERRRLGVGSGRRGGGAGHVRDRDRDLDLRHDRPPRGDPAARYHRRRQGRDPPGPVRLRGRPSGGRRHARVVRRRRGHGFRQLRQAREGGGEARSGRDRAGRARLVERQPFDPRRRRPHGCDLRTGAAYHARADLPRAARSRSRSAADGSWTTSRSTDSCSRRSWPAAGSPSAAR